MILQQLGLSPHTLIAELGKHQKYKQLLQVNEAEKKEGERRAWFEWLRKFQSRLAHEVTGDENVEAAQQKRLAVMQTANPVFVLRNFVAQKGIDAAEKLDFSEVRRQLDLCRKPYSEQCPAEYIQPPKDAKCLRVTCSS
eukprot:TRINITY_DN4307_c0_g1_i2.p1 TRINITY_DN4307_c0_g1~~TRINITY_DN4307_c0_g1_i2.p1  ORF type:complete len:139 (+),score=39.37 TRINITY_DN4307_c0_g1_i2:168-584(+)